MPDKPQTPPLARKIPLLPLRELIVFPHEVVPLFVGREKSINALEEAMATDRAILLCAQKKAKVNDPKPEGIHTVGTIGSIIQLLRLPDGTVKVLVEGKSRARIGRYIDHDKYFLVEAELLEPAPVSAEDEAEISALMRSVQQTFENYVKLNKRVPPELAVSVQSIDNPSRMADTIAAHVNFKLTAKQELLETESIRARLEKLYELMQNEIEILQVEKKIRTRVKKQMEKNQKEYYLNEQMQAIQKELGSQDEFKNEIAELEERVRRRKMSAEATDRLKKELRKLKMMSPMSAEATVVRNYIDTVLALPWDERTVEKLDIAEAEGILDADHYGLDKPKERIVEYLAVRSLVPKLKGPILCLVGPPGVGKTSLAKSVARATNRKFVRVSLGGVRDEAEIRGHRRTYIGAMPGKIIQGLRKAGSNNPVFLLDEIDKISMDFRGDPSAAMLEVLDPEQNSAFVDHFLDLDYDLSDVLFLCTANSLHSIPLPLQDRMEIIELSGYTDEEKQKIARQYLIPKQLEANGMQNAEIVFTDQAVRELIHHYTKEAGVRSLERAVSSVVRKLAREYVKDGKKKKSFKVDLRLVQRLLGAQKYRYNSADASDQIGMTNGLAVTIFGGDLLPAEVTLTAGKGKVTLTGKLGEVMQESAQAAVTYVRSRSPSLGLEPDFHEHVDFHVHFPEGAVPKDGPSAGVTIVTSLVSALLRVPVRKDVAMTGEINLRGRVLPIGGLKDKVLAAFRGEMKTVICPRDNEKDLADVPKHVLKALDIKLADTIDDVLRWALVPLPEDHPNVALRKFLAGVDVTSPVDWREVNRYLEERRRKDREAHESGVH
ncbi:endopeptidase La [Nannocystis sp.]|uniref:endopeptidase La n=1 Tax=Nannocystis sp. TaxID=1962667 RepID=UPI0025E818E4|nr:endopeptidase La [Nannocystis sp.]MBK7828192.1 endopeptidase La [Nannocystis sp.]